jgi:hypothetical protein
LSFLLPSSSSLEAKFTGRYSRTRAKMHSFIMRWKKNEIIKICLKYVVNKKFLKVANYGAKLPLHANNFAIGEDIEIDSLMIWYASCSEALNNCRTNYRHIKYHVVVNKLS